MAQKDSASDEGEFASDGEGFIESYARRLFEQTRRLVEHTDEKELISLATSKTMIVHFYKPMFSKCIFMNKALQCIAPKFPHIKFVYIDVAHAPHMTRSLGVTALPFLAFFREGYLVDQMVGFEKLGNSNNGFEVAELEEYIKDSNIFQQTA